MVSDQEGMMKIAVDFYKNCFSAEDMEPLSLAQDF